MEQIKTHALVLHRYPYRDSSWIVKVLTPNQGVVSFVVKGGKRKESPFKGAFDPLACVEIVYRHSHKRDLQMPMEASIVRWHNHLRSNLESTALAQVMAEVVLRGTHSLAHGQQEFQLLKSMWESLDNAEVYTSDILVRFLLSFIEILGIGLQMDTCVQCQGDIAEIPADLWPALGGAVCKSCLGERSPHWTLEIRKDLWAITHRVPVITIEALARIEHFLLSYLRIHLGSELEIRSLKWLDSLRTTYSQGGYHVE